MKKYKQSFESRILFFVTQLTQIIVKFIHPLQLQSKLTFFSTAEEGPALFDIKGVEGKATKEGIKAMKDLLFNTFDSHETLRTFSEPCPLPTEKPHQIEEYCANKC